MKKNIPVTCFLACLLSSCATILNGPSTDITVHTPKPSTITVRGIKYTGTRALISVPRSRLPLTITVVTDSTRKEVSVRRTNSIAWFLNIPYTDGLGMLIDWDHPKRYSYPRHIYIDPSDTSRPYATRLEQIHYKGTWNLQFAIPYANFFLQHPYQEPLKTSAGFFGITGGVDYYHRDNQFIRLAASAASAYPFPVPAPIDKDFSESQQMWSSDFSLTNNYDLRHFSLGYGLAFVINNWQRDTIDNSVSSAPRTVRIRKYHNTMGIVLTAAYYFTSSFNVGVAYKPTFYNFGKGQSWQYEHLVSIHFGWRINLHTPPPATTGRTAKY